jgi:hypothetical protein
MQAVKVTIRRFVDAAFPGWVECGLVDAWGRVWTFVEKVPVVTSEDLDASNDYPQPAVIACQILARRHDSRGREVVTIDTQTPWHVEATTGEVRFDVLPEQLAELDQQ